VPNNADFLTEGAKSYVDALAAIEAFEQQVRGVCEDVYKKYRLPLVSKIGLKDEDCGDHDNKQPANRNVELGVLQNSPSGREVFYIYIMWDGAKDGAPELSACVSLQCYKKSDRNEYAELLRRIPSIQSGDDNGYYLWSQKTLNDLSSWAETFDKLLDEWLACWPAKRRLQ